MAERRAAVRRERSPRRSGVAPSRRPPARRAPTEDDRAASPRYLVHTVPGLEDVAIDEVKELVPDAKVVGAWRRFDERTSLLEFRAEGSPKPWLKLATAEDVFALAARGQALRSGEAGLGDLYASVITSRLLDRAMRALASVHRGAPPTSYRVVARMAGEHGFRRVDAQRAVASAIRKRFPKLRLREEEADAELWLSLVGGDALVAVRLSSGEMRGSRKELRTLPASLKPSIARSMVRLSKPQADDVVLDPFCGAGTLLIERGLAGPYDELHGGDRDHAAASRARANLRLAGLQGPIKEWDARDLPLEDGSIDVVLTNPPFGKQLGMADEPEPFYKAFVAELARVLKPGGRMVLITNQYDAFQAAAQAVKLRIRKRFGVVVRGERATIFGCEKPA